MDTIALIEQLMEVPGPSGFEDAVALAIGAQLEGLPGESRCDAIGNLIHRLPAPSGAPSLMLMAHMDEVGLLVKHIDADGMVYCAANGLIDERTLQGSRVQIWTESGPVLAVVGAKSRHQVSEADLRMPAAVNDLWVDVGADSADAVRALGVRIGQPATTWSPPAHIGDGRLVGKAIDNRAGCATLVQVARAVAGRPRDYELVLVWSTQEEVGARGARVAAQALQPTAAVVVDTMPAVDPSTPERYATARVGGGPVIRVQDARGTAGTLYSQAVRRRLEAIAEAEGIGYQVDVYPTFTDACEVHLAGRGIATGGVFIPRRCSHSPNEVVDSADVEGTVALLTAFTAGLDAAAVRELPVRPAFPLVR